MSIFFYLNPELCNDQDEVNQTTWLKTQLYNVIRALSIDNILITFLYLVLLWLAGIP